MGHSKHALRSGGRKHSASIAPRTIDFETIYCIKEFLDEGTIGKVYKASLWKDQSSEQQLFCVKVTNLEAAKTKILSLSKYTHSTEKDVTKLLYDEVEILRAVRPCEFIVTYIDSFEWKGKLSIVTEYCTPGNLYDVKQRFLLTEDDHRAILYCVLQAIDYLHKHRFVHGDVKLDNILLCRSGMVKLCDFGGAERCNEDGFTSSRSLGTVQFAPPEIIAALILNRDSSVEEPCFHRSRDIWGIGALALTLEYNKPQLAELWEDKGAREIYGLITRKSISSNRRVGGESVQTDLLSFRSTDEVSSKRRSFVAEALTLHYSSRPYAEDLLRHQFIRKIKSEASCRRCLKELLERCDEAPDNASISESVL